MKLPVVPLRIDGAYEIREAGSMFNRPGRIRVHIGKPVEFPAGSDPQEIARSLEQCVAELGKDAGEKGNCEGPCGGGVDFGLGYRRLQHVRFFVCKG